MEKRDKRFGVFSLRDKGGTSQLFGGGGLRGNQERNIIRERNKVRSDSVSESQKYFVFLPQWCIGFSCELVGLCVP